MKRYQLVGNKIRKATKEFTAAVVEKINDIIIPVRHNMTAPGHKSIAKTATSDIFKTTYAVDAVTLRARKSETGSSISVYGLAFKTIMNNSPYTKALVEANGDFNKKDTPDEQIKHWDKGQKELVNDYKVTCNKVNENGKVCISTSALCIVDFSMLEADLNKIFQFDSNKKERVAQEKKTIINKVLNVGLVKSGKYMKLASEGQVAKRYEVISWSPSSERNETALFSSIEQYKAFEIIDKVSGGTLFNALYKERKIQDVVKFTKRIGQLSAPSTEMGAFGNSEFGAMIYMKETEGPEDYVDAEREKLAGIGVEIDRNTFDGAIVYKAQYMQKFLASAGRKVSLQQANLFAIQSRCSVLLSKVFGESKSDFNIDFRAARYRAMVPKERILEVEAGTDVTGLNKKDYDLIVVGNPNNIGIIMDINGGKALKDITLQQMVDGNYMNYALDVAKCSETKTSGQMLQKFMAANKTKTIEIVKSLALKQFNNSLDKFLEGDINVKECSLAQYLTRYGSEDALANTEVLRSIIDTEMAMVESQLKNYKVEVDAIFLRALFDDAYFITNGAIDGVLGASKYTGKLEAYSYDVELRYKDQIEAIYADETITNKEEALDKLLTGVAFKYPSPSADESAVMTFKTSRVLAERIANNNSLTRQQREVLIDDFVNTAFGVIKMAPNNTIKHRLAGMDTDFDGVAIVFERELVEMVMDSLVDNDGFTTIKSVK